MAKTSDERVDVVADPAHTRGHALWTSLLSPDASLATLIVANLLPLAGVLLFGWDAGVILVLYWAENLVVGFYNILKMLLARGDEGSTVAAKLFLIPFFIFHFGGFCAVHGVFVDLFASGLEAGGDAENFFPDPDVWWGPLMFVGLLVGVVQAMWVKYAPQIFFALLGLLVSHGVSFVQNYLWRGEYRERTVKRQMFQPYGRVALMHVAIIAAALPVMLLGSPLPLLVIIIALKIVIDSALHVFIHNGDKQAAEPAPG